MSEAYRCDNCKQMREGLVPLTLRIGRWGDDTSFEFCSLRCLERWAVQYQAQYEEGRAPRWVTSLIPPDNEVD